MAEFKSTADPIADFVRKMHANHRSAAPRYADSAGAFWETGLEALMGPALPIVVDANVLRGDIAHACKRGHRTVLGTGAHSGAFRLFCAPHVVEEIEEYSGLWASEYGEAHEFYLQIWREHYVPYLRVVETQALRRLLSPAELSRIDALRALDPDDVPSATLAITIGAIYLSEDGRAHLSVYNVPRSAEERRNWLSPLMSGTDAGELHRVRFLSAGLPIWAFSSLFKGAARLYDISPWALLAVAGATAFLASRIKRDTYLQVGHALGRVAVYLFENVFLPYEESMRQLQVLLPPFPQWEDLQDTNDRDSILTRACLHTMARSRLCPMSLSDLVEALPPLGIGQDAPRVGKMLKNELAFVEPYHRRWQVGTALIRGAD